MDLRERMPEVSRKRLDFVAYASERLRACGFQFVYASRKSEACYYQFPGVPALIRVAAHRFGGERSDLPKEIGLPVKATITFSQQFDHARYSWVHAENMVCQAIGSYFLSTFTGGRKLSIDKKRA